MRFFDPVILSGEAHEVQHLRVEDPCHKPAEGIPRSLGSRAFSE